MLKLRVASTFSALVLLVAGCCGQESPASPVQSSEPTQSLFFTALNRNRTPLGPLAPDMLEMKGAQRIVKVDLIGETPLSIGIITDESNSGRDAYAVQAAAVKKLIEKMFRPGKDRGAFLSFDSKVYLRQDWTSSVEPLVNATLKGHPGGGSAMYDAVFRLAEAMRLTTPQGTPRVIFLFSDGEDNQSLRGRLEALGALQRAGVRVYGITVSVVSRPYTTGDEVLKSLAANTGGRTMSVYETNNKSLSAFDKPYKIIEADLRNWYRVEFVPQVSGNNKPEMMPFQMKLKLPKTEVLAPAAYPAGFSIGALHPSR